MKKVFISVKFNRYRHHYEIYNIGKTEFGFKISEFRDSN